MPLVHHLAADGRPLVEPANRCTHLLDLTNGPTAATSPALAVDVVVRHDRVYIVHWLFGERFRVIFMQGQA